MMSTEIFSFDIRGDKHIEKAIAVAMSDLFREDKVVELTGYSLFEDETRELRFYTGKGISGFTPFPCTITNPTEMILGWLAEGPWPHDGQYSDVTYKQGYRIFNVGLPYEHSLVFAVQPHWTEYHK